ncbi:GLPGLI family protein [Flavobacterium sp.]|jgi:GLPGLI family protein|uniref:GLPGLI family protein n=1 Tax=Flavobacterium sp. TaxID=239 RepID=UPI0022BE88A5|nr:GLPGLI family protein [Flavobacterium sp.]MCZ8144302.1 GLPGLI family protein [Flavobacterium sp.]MCZ8367670.1 GLPGLI family protein [Flavobacterium sp.]
MKKWMLIGLLAVQCISAQTFRITYQKSSNGTIIPNQDPVIVLAAPHMTLISSAQMLQQKASYPREETFVDRKRNTLVQKAQLNAQRFIVSLDSISLEKQQFELTSETKTILGYECKKAVTSINSNTLELWYTDALGVKGAPTVLGQNLGMVLEIVRNGNFVTTAISIEKEKQKNAIVLPDTKNGVDLLSYRDLVWKSRFITLPIFEKETIHFSDQAQSNDSIFRFANGTIAVRKIKFPIIPPGSKVFIDLIEQSNGDAYDRTGSVFLIPTDKANTFWNGLTQGANSLPLYENGNGKKYQGVVATNSYIPLLELMRFFTPFGISHFNHISLKDKTWQTQVPYRQDISELTSSFSGKEVYLGAFIGNYDKGGHRISMNITLHPEAQSSAASPLVVPLFNTVNVMEMAGQEYGTMFNHEKGLEVTFTLTQDLRGARLRYLTTGHGGWENGDEFVPKKNTILLDGKEVISIVPWREDCGSYRLFNPASGNFPNGLSSSDYSRSNWCPGMVTYPYYIDLGDLKAGTHTLQVKIPQGAPEGSSFSAWNVSGVLLGY